MKKIILVNGKKRSGKDYFSGLLKQELESNGRTVQIMHLADPMKEIISTVFECTKDELEEYKNNPERFPVTVFEDTHGARDTDFRKILQLFGSEGMKPHFGDDVWAQLLMNKANKSNDDFIIVPDFRFLCEARSPYTVNVFNDDINCTDSHKSENELNDFKFKYTIDNTGHKDITSQVQEVANGLLNS